MASRAALFTGMYPHNTGIYSFNDGSHPWISLDMESDNVFS
jgi:arylsulfatase A-like enzyme